MTRDEFEAVKHDLACQRCEHVGLDGKVLANNGGYQPFCPRCGSVKPRDDMPAFLPKTKARAPKRAHVNTIEVWQANGDHCSHCDRSRKACERLGIGLTAQHIVPFAEAGDDYPLIPYCQRCQEKSVAEQRLVRDEDRVLSSLDETIRRIEDKNPWLRGQSPPPDWARPR